jgi:hypothetical protein
LELKIKSKAISKLQEIVDDGGPSALQAARILLNYDKHLAKKTKNPVGRPPKPEDKPDYTASIEDDFERLGLVPSQTQKLN